MQGFLLARSMAYSMYTTQVSFRPELPPLLVVGRTTRSLGGRVLARMGLSLVNDLAAIGAVPQHQVERPARERLAADAATRSARPGPGCDPPGFELLLQQPDRAEFGIAAEDRAYEFGLAVDDDELAVLRPIPKRWHSAHPHPLPL